MTVSTLDAMPEEKPVQPPRVAAGLVVLDHQTRILLVRRGPEAATGAGEWAVPGGKLDPGERIADCAVRETKEEVDVDVAGLIRLDTLTEDLQWGSHLHFISLYFMTTRWTGVPRIMEPTKHVDLRWVHPDEIRHAVAEPSEDLPLFGPLIEFVRQGGLDEIAAKLASGTQADIGKGDGACQE